MTTQSGRPSRVRRGRRAAAAAGLATAVLAGTGVAVADAADAPSAECVVAAAGDVAGAEDYLTGAAGTARLISEADPVTVLALGDLAYDDGTVAEFERYYLPTWGAFRDRTEAVPGNHEARTRGFAGIEAALGDRADDNHAVTVCGWRIVLLNQYKGIPAADRYLRRQARENPGMPLLAVWHEPRFSSGKHGNEPGVQRLWHSARATRTRIVLNAHDHDYERFAPQTSAGRRADDDSGTRQFVSGLGGHKPRPFRTVRAHSEARVTGIPSVLFLTLEEDGSYSWALRSVDGEVRDAGSHPPLP